MLAKKYGFFLPRGVSVSPLDTNKKWQFTPEIEIGGTLPPGGVLGSVPEGPFKHKIMIPFNEAGPVKVTWIRGDSFSIDEVVARYQTSAEEERELTLAQRWPIRRPIPENLLRKRYVERQFPAIPLTTATRIIDTFFPSPKAAPVVFRGHSAPVKRSCKV